VAAALRRGARAWQDPTLSIETENVLGRGELSGFDAAETTVTLTGSGLGGRNQELALAAVAELAGLPDVLLVTLATDGEDGPTDAAGAVINGQTWTQALQAGLYPPDFLARNDAYSFFAALGDLLHTGPTGTNVNDLMFLFSF
jgi:hydroxypyruvate reductase